jgi:CO/xanthine dehydrogenase FAD-binding subunit
VTGRSLTSVFAYARPNDLDGALALLTQVPGARPLGGGTDLLVALRKAAHRPPLVIDLKRIGELTAGIEERDGWLRIAATTVMTDVTTDERIRVAFPALAEAAEVVGSIQIRNRATLAGNLCNASPAADTAPALLVHGAVVVAAGPDGTRRIGLDDFFVRSGVTMLRPGELLAAVEIPPGSSRIASAHERRTRRRGHDLASVTVACGVDAAGVVRLAFGSLGPRPVLGVDETGTLADPATPADVRDALLEPMLDGATPSATSMRAGPEYRLAMLRVHARRALARALERRASGEGVR